MGASPAHRRTARLLLWALAVSLARPALAQSAGDSAAAQALFDQAKALMRQGNAADACPKLEESQRLDPGSGTLINLADCYGRVGRLASAWTKYLEAASAASAVGNADREREARERGAALAPRVPKLVIEVATDARVPGLVVTRDGAPVGAAQWGMPIPVDAGPHPIAAEAPGHEPWSTVATIAGEGTTTTLSVPRLAGSAVPVSQVASRAQPLPLAPGGDPGPQTSTGLGAQRAIALVVGGLGVVGLGVGAAFAIKSKSKHDEAEKYCNGADCTDARGVTAGEDAQAAGTIATIGLVAGGAAVAGGVVLWFTAPTGGGHTSVAFGFGTVGVQSVW